MANPKMRVPTAEELVSMWQVSGLKGKLIFTFVMIALFRLGAHVPLFGIDAEAFREIIQSGGGNNIIGFLDMFSGGALGRVSVFALGVGPYITASIIMQLLSAALPALERLQKEEGEEGRRKISQYTRRFTVGLALFQSFALMTYLTKINALQVDSLLSLTFIGAVLSLATGAIFIMWIAELVTERGLGNGGSLLIFAGILAGIPFYIKQTAKLVGSDAGMQFGLFILMLVFLATIVMIIIMQEAMRKVIIVNAKRQVGNKVYGGVNTHIPFKLNPGGVMPIIFAVAILLFPSTVLSVAGQANIPEGFLKETIAFLSNNLFNPGGMSYYVLYFVLIVALTFFYASIMPNMQPKDIAKNLKKHGSSIPGIKPGKPTADALEKILSRVTFIGALGLGIIALVPGIFTSITHIDPLQGIGATALIIMVGVALDFINQIKTHLLARQYEGFLKQ